jgi:hypothetical protein
MYTREEALDILGKHKAASVIECAKAINVLSKPYQFGQGPAPEDVVKAFIAVARDNDNIWARQNPMKWLVLKQFHDCDRLIPKMSEAMVRIMNDFDLSHFKDHQKYREQIVLDQLHHMHNLALQAVETGLKVNKQKWATPALREGLEEFLKNDKSGPDDLPQNREAQESFIRARSLKAEIDKFLLIDDALDILKRHLSAPPDKAPTFNECTDAFRVLRDLRGEDAQKAESTLVAVARDSKCAWIRDAAINRLIDMVLAELKLKPKAEERNLATQNLMVAMIAVYFDEEKENFKDQAGKTSSVTPNQMHRTHELARAAISAALLSNPSAELKAVWEAEFENRREKQERKKTPFGKVRIETTQKLDKGGIAAIKNLEQRRLRDEKKARLPSQKNPKPDSVKPLSDAASAPSPIAAAPAPTVRKPAPVNPWKKERKPKDSAAPPLSSATLIKKRQIEPDVSSPTRPSETAQITKEEAKFLPPTLGHIAYMRTPRKQF